MDLENTIERIRAAYTELEGNENRQRELITLLSEVLEVFQD